MDMGTRTKVALNTALKVVGVAGLSGITIAAPNALQALDLILEKSSASESDYVKLLKELKRQGLVIITPHGEEVRFNLTPAGAYRLQEIIIDELEIDKPSTWDKKWRLVTFDIPIKYSTQRKYFVDQLQNLGFVMIQRSLWVHPFPCFEQVELIGGHYNVLRYCSLMEISRLDDLSTRRLLLSFKDLLS
ncbi:hypothetical protein HYS42_00060 [Candidatus Saccharibacteria bacterium]|nr:hypothetical protein [Candidatus Saccharibacteria bacterium]